MKIEKTLNHIVKLLSFGDFPNKEELQKDYEELKKVINSSFHIDSFPETTKRLKANQFYRQFKLDTKPQIFKAIINKTSDFKIVEGLLALSSEINYSSQEEIVLKQRLNILNSFSFLEQDLQEAKGSEEENESGSFTCRDDFFEVYFEDLEKLKEILSSTSISIENLDWFFGSDLFEFISGASDCFDVKLIDLYKILLENAEINTRKDFIKHKQLLEKAQKEGSLDYKEFYAVLSNTKKQLADNLRKSTVVLLKTTCNLTIFEKISNIATLSPVAKKALLNNLKKCKDSPHLNSLKR